ncbi:hypothetical protein ABZ319_02570 [Nocardia sp. NPDC005978]|uniref:hypothetical protein n=1 Tax=Nocardia sp. NPDC005978 TaxID=3156725 RepID=UPI0033B38178
MSDETSGSATASESQARLDKPPARPISGTVSIRRSTLVTGVALLTAAAVAGTTTTLWLSARSDLSAADAARSAERRAEQVATDYAVGAATIDYRQADAWVGKLKANTSPQLAGKFDATAGKLQEILVPLQWTSTAAPLAAKVADTQGELYRVNVFVNVTSKSAQNPDGVQTTATYTVSVDAAQGWQVVDVGGAEGAFPAK